MDKFVAINTNGKVSIHARDASGSYQTLCGLDGDDNDPYVQQSPADLPDDPKINCSHCEAIFLVAMDYKMSDFNV